MSEAEATRLDAAGLIRFSGNIRTAFDGALAPEFKELYSALDHAISVGVQCEKQYNRASRKHGAAQVQRLRYTTWLLQKSTSDIIASVEVLRTGFLALSHGILRSGIESFSTALCVYSNNDIAARYHEGKLSVQDSVYKIPAVRLPKDQKDNLIGIYKYLNHAIHPTATAIRATVSAHNGEFPKAGAYDPPRLKLYRQHVSNLELLADHIAVWGHDVVLRDLSVL